MACECYAVVKLVFDRLLSDIPRHDLFHTLVNLALRLIHRRSVRDIVAGQFLFALGVEVMCPSVQTVTT